MEKEFVKNFVNKLQQKEFRNLIIAKSKSILINDDSFYRYTLRKRR